MPSRSLTSAAYAGRDDLRAMQSIVSTAWTSPARPHVSCTVGDLEWWIVNGGPDVDWSGRIRIWSIGGDPVGWGWHGPSGSLDWFVHPGLSDDDAGAVRDEILDWHRLLGLHDAREQVLAASDDVELARLEAWAADDWPESIALRRHGWTATDMVLTQYLQALDLDLDPLRLPEGYVLRSLRDPDDVPARVEVHRAAFAPSRMTIEKYGILRAQDHYAFERDIVLEAADGTFAAFAICWPDEAGSVGEFEPVGTHPDHQRRGLGRVIMRHGLRLMRAAGLRDAIVFSLRSNAASEALYRSAGFHEIALHRRWTKALESTSRQEPNGP